MFLYVGLIVIIVIAVFLWLLTSLFSSSRVTLDPREPLDPQGRREREDPPESWEPLALLASAEPG